MVVIGCFFLYPAFWLVHFSWLLTGWWYKTFQSSFGLNEFIIVHFWSRIPPPSRGSHTGDVWSGIPPLPGEPYGWRLIGYCVNSERYEKYGRNPSWIVKRYGRKASRIVIRYGKYGRKISWIVKRFGKYGRKAMSNSDKIWAI